MYFRENLCMVRIKFILMILTYRDDVYLYGTMNVIYPLLVILPLSHTLLSVTSGPSNVPTLPSPSIL